MNIYLPIEVKVRELEGKLLLAFIAAQRGHTVLIGEKKDALNLARDGHLPPGIVHDKSLTPGDYKIKNFTKLKENGHQITAQDEESGLMDESFDHFARRRFSEKTVSLADRIFAWGPHDFQSLKRIYPEYADKFLSTGSPRVDFWRSEFDGYYGKNASAIKPYIFIASNFGFPIDEKTFWDRISRLRKSGYFDRDPGMESYMYENTAYQFRLLYQFVDMIRKLSKAFPDFKILVRPHPVESVDAWKQLVGEYPNVIIERKDTISGWIRNASVLIHNGCTSALESTVSGLPRIAYRPIPHELEREVPNNTSLHAFSFDELEKMVRHILEDGKTNGIEENEKKAKEVIERRFSSLTGKLAAEKIVDEWERLGESAGLDQSTVAELIQLKNQHSKKLKRKNFKKNLKQRAVRIRDFLLNDVDKKNRWQKKTNHKFPFLKDEEVDTILIKLKKSLNRTQSISAVRIGEKSFIIFKGEK